MNDYKKNMELSMRHMALTMAEAILAPNPIMDAYLAQRKAEWDKLSWLEKKRRHINFKISKWQYRFNRAWLALCGEED